jgi:tetratricopeptide (TPR) repeat protein
MADAISAPDQACAGLLEQYEKFMACGKQLAAARCLESATPELQKRPCVALALAEARSLLGKYAAAEGALKSADKVKISLGERLRIESGLALLLVHTSRDQSEGIKQAQLRTAKALRCAELEPDLSSVDKAHIMVDRAKAILIAASRWQVDVQADLEFRGACDVLEDASSILKLHGAPRAAMTARFLLVDSKEKIDEQLTLLRTVAKDATDLGQIGIAFEARIRAARILALTGDRSFTAAKIVEELKDVQGASDEVWPIEASVERRLVGTDSSDLLQYELASSVEDLAEGGAVGPAWHLARRLADLAIDRKEHETATIYLQRAHSLAKDVGCQHLLAETELVDIRLLISMQKLAEAIGACDGLLRPGVVRISAEQRFRILTDAANALLATGQYDAGLERKTKARAALEAANNGGNLIFTRHRIAVDCEESNLEPLQELNKLLKLAADDIKQFFASRLQYQRTVLDLEEKDLERASSLQAQETEPYLERAEESLQKAKNMNIMKEEKSSANAGLWYSLTGTVIVCRLMKDFFDQALKDFLDQAQKNYNEATGYAHIQRSEISFS